MPNPETTENLLEKGNLFFAQKKYKEALECNEEALKINPNSAKAWSNRKRGGEKRKGNICGKKKLI